MLLSAGTGFGQPAFEVASVKPSSPDARGQTFQFTPGEGLAVKNGTLKGLIETAYNVRDFQISGGPGWLDSERYDVFAKTAADDPEARTRNRTAQIDETRVRLQLLLSQRFQLKVHREMRELPVFALTVGRSGSKLKEIDGTDADAKPGTGIRSGCGQMTGTRSTMANLAFMLSRQLGRPVLERTGISGVYDFQLQWTPEAGECPEPATGIDPDGPSLFTALQSQLGLKLDSTKGPVEIIVIDHAEKAAEN